ncbi:NUDIX hydrolase N-terminal domain-containing protein [Clostridium gasigenes]|uniref:NUDIX hydrolase n=1 Tax=Clostridium gasigenes TaxID=94869 RepID=UPI001C0C5940|nr:NUDIX hydrolase N-terminal domain-containing protein [Clostridium gasigenes]MBU3133125.1 NUDIX hydrolase N-terminal domain-containing protein [Clostridium gasigenes]
MKYSHIVFDIDGTLIDTEKAILMSLQKTILDEKGIKKDLQELHFALGITGKDALLQLGIDDIDYVQFIWDEIFKKYSGDICIFDGIRRLLEELKANSITLGIITSKTRKEYEDDFIRFGIAEYFDTVICADDSNEHKPNAEPMEKYLQYANAKRKETLYIGDSVYDMQCATSAGVDCALAIWGRIDSGDIEATYYLNFPKDVLNVLVDNNKHDDVLLDWAIELQFLSQCGLTYSKDLFDIERFERIREISVEIVSTKAGLSLEKVNNLFCNETGFQTPKLDTRAAVFKDKKILLVKEVSSGTWSMPGGWVDVNQSIYSNTIKEVNEEAGLDVIPERLIAVQDRNKHNIPKYAYGICKVFVLCNVLGGEFKSNIETSESKLFSLDELPELSVEKNTKEQIKMCFMAEQDDNWKVMFD